MTQGYRFEKGSDGIAIITMDMIGQPVNTMSQAFDPVLQGFVDQFIKDPEVKGAILTSAKETFFAGGDLKELLAVETDEQAQQMFDRIEGIKQLFRQMELAGKPMVAAINGSALGGGLELALACHARFVLDKPGVKLGLPEVTLGLLPGGGGITRLVRMLGLQAALPYLNEGKLLRPQQALEASWVNGVVDSPEALIEAAKGWILANPAPQQPWDVKGYKIPGGTPASPKISQMLMLAPAMVHKATRGLLPAPQRILATAAEGASVDFETASRIETRGLVELTRSAVAKNLISTFFFGLNAVNGGASRPQGPAKSQFKRVGVLGAGMMGAGIAYATAKAGIDVVLKDISLENAEKGKNYSAKLLDKAIQRGRADEASKAALLERIVPTAEVQDLASCDLIIEAVFEDEQLKDKVIRETEAVMAPGVPFTSNTSTLPISMLAQSSRNAEQFIGLHFFSPVDKMPLVEIIRGEHTSDETVAKAFDFVRQIGKVAIVVNDRLGFYTSRVFSTFIDEGIQLLKDGVAPLVIDNCAMGAGFPVGPLTVSDEVSEQLQHSVNQSNARLVEQLSLDPKLLSRPASFEIIPKMIEAGRKGRQYGGGFYDYSDNGGKRVWPGLAELVGAVAAELPLADVSERLLFRKAIESVKCLDEGVLEQVMDGNIGSIMGIGFPRHTGGAFQYINSYGLAAFVARADELAERYGERFRAPDSLRALAASGGQYR